VKQWRQAGEIRRESYADQAVPVCTPFGKKTLGAVQMGAGIVSTGSSGSDASGTGGGLSGFQTGVGIVGIAKSLGAPIPVVGSVIAGISVGLDFVGTAVEIANCR